MILARKAAIGAVSILMFNALCSGVILADEKEKELKNLPTQYIAETALQTISGTHEAIARQDIASRSLRLFSCYATDEEIDKGENITSAQ